MLVWKFWLQFCMFHHISVSLWLVTFICLQPCITDSMRSVRNFMFTLLLVITTWFDAQCCELKEQEMVKQAEGDGNAVTVFQRLEEHGGAVNTCAFYGNSLVASGSGSVSISLMKALVACTEPRVVRCRFFTAEPRTSCPRVRSGFKIPVHQLNLDSKL
jgi:hypothetical protein